MPDGGTGRQKAARRTARKARAVRAKVAPGPAAVSGNGDGAVIQTVSAAALPGTEEPVGPIRAGLRSAREAFRTTTDVRTLAATPYGLKPVVIFGLIGIVLGLDADAFSLVLPDIIRDKEYSVVGLLTAINLVGFVLIFATLAMAYYLDKANRVIWNGIALILNGISSFFTSRTNTIWTLGATRLMNSVSDQAANLPFFSLLTDYYPVDARGRAITFQRTLGRVAGLIAPLAIGYLVVRTTTDELHPNWRLPFMITGPALAFMGLLVLLLLREPVRGYFERRELGASEGDAQLAEERPSFGEAWRIVWSIQTYRRLFIAGIALAIGDLAFRRFYLLFLFDHYGLSTLQRGALFSVTGIGVLVGGLFGGGMADVLIRRRPQRLLVFSGTLGVLGALTFFFIPLGPPIPLLVAITIVFGFFDALVLPALFVVRAQILPAHIRTTGVWITILENLPAVIVFQSALTAVVPTYGLRGGMFLAAPFILIGAIIQLSAAELFEGDMRSAQASQLATAVGREAKREGRAKLLVCRGVDVAYNNVQVLFNVDLDVEEGEIVALLGTNGAGKSTLLKAIAGAQVASSGGIVFDGREITYMPPHEIARKGVILMPGGRGIFPELTVRENLMLGNWLTDPSEERSRLDEIYEVFPILRQRRNERAGTLSGGEQQMLSLAQAFLARPKLLMIDELSLGLAPNVVRELVEKVKNIHKLGVTIVIVEQSVNVALTIAERAVFMEKGEVKFVGPTRDLLRRPDILRAVYVKGTGALSGAPRSAVRTEHERRRQTLEQARPILEAKEISKSFGGIKAVDDVSFALRDGESLGLIGPNGAGKTTVFDLVSGYEILDAGRIVFDGVDVTKLGPDERARRRLVRRFQDARLFPSLTVYENLLVSLEHQLEVKSVALNALQLPQVRRAERRIRTRADRLIELLDLGAFRDKFVKELSTGLRRITDIGCVLATEPKVLLLDEPSTGIAQAEAEQLAPLLRRVRVETGCSLMIIEHDMSLIASISDELLAMDQGKVIVRDVPDKVLNHPRVVESYLGTTEAAIRRSGATK